MANAKQRIRQQMAAGVGDPQLRELVQEIFIEVGGANKIARLIAKKLRARKGNDFNQARLLDLILRAVKQSNDMHSKDDLGLMTNEELDRALEEALKGFVGASIPEGTGAKEGEDGGCPNYSVPKQGSEAGGDGAPPDHRDAAGSVDATGGGEGAAEHGGAEPL